MEHISSDKLSKAAEAAKRREEETARVAAAQGLVDEAKSNVLQAKGQVLMAEGEKNAAQIREDAAARVVRLHLADALPLAPAADDDPFDRAPPGVGGGGPRPPVAQAPAPMADPPWWNHWGWAAVALIALILSLIALGLWLDSRDKLKEVDTVSGLARSTATTLLDVGKKADRGVALGVANSKAIADLSQKQADFATNTKQELDKKCNCDSSKAPAKGKKKDKRPPKSATTPPLLPLVPALVAPPPKVAAPCPECIPKEKATVQREEKAKVCGIAIQKAVGDPTIIGRLQLDEDEAHPGLIRIASVLSFEGVATKVSVSPYPHSSNKDCDRDQATVYQHWPEVVRKFNLPVECIPVRLRG